MNHKSDKTIKGMEIKLEMVYSMGATLGLISDMSDDVMRIDLYSFSYSRYRNLGHFLLNSTCFLLLESTKTPISI